MYLPDEIPGADVLITVKTYPLPSNKYNELVCTAGFLSNGKWIRLYPMPFRALPYEVQYSKYEWITLDLVRNTSDYRPESYRPAKDIDDIKVSGKIDTQNFWEKRKSYALKEVFTSMEELIRFAKSDERKSLATLKPAEIIDLVIEPSEREWKQQWKDQLLQYNLFDLDEKGEGKIRKVIPKLPFKFSYKFISEGDSKPRTLMIEDWELGALYWNCRRKYSEEEAKSMVRQKYFDEFLAQKDIYLFLGTTLQYHLVSPNPFLIIGVFYPPKIGDVQQLSLF